MQSPKPTVLESAHAKFSGVKDCLSQTRVKKVTEHIADKFKEKNHTRTKPWDVEIVEYRWLDPKAMSKTEQNDLDEM